MTEGYAITRLSNGLRLVVAPMPDRYSATVAVYVGTGSRYESAAQAGSAHMLEHMLFKGTQRRPTAEDISTAIESVGGSLNASTDKEVTVYWAKVAGEDVPLALDVLSDMLLHSRLDPAEERKEKRVVAEELGMAMDAPQDWIHTLIEETIWPGEALGRDVAGTRESVARLTRAGLLRFLHRHYTPQATVVSIAGRVDPEALCTLCLATRGLSHSDPRRYALDLLNTILGGGMSSRLFVEVRERLGLVYDIHSYADRLDDTGMLVIYAGMDPPACRHVIRVILAAQRRLRDEPVEGTELERAKNQFKGRLLLGLEDTSSVANWYGAQELVLHRICTPEEVLADMYAVTADDIQRLAAELFRDEYLRLALIGPHNDEREFEELLHLP